MEPSLPSHVAAIDFADLDGRIGFALTGVVRPPLNDELSGRSVGGAGDFNGDGFDDVMVGGLTETHLVLGAGGGFGAELELDSLEAGSGFALPGSESVSGAGDVNGDGFDDLILGRLGGDDSALLVFGEADGSGSNRSRLLGGSYSVSRAGDVNGDGLADLIVGAPRAERAYVVFGADGFPAAVDMASLDGRDGFALSGGGPYDLFGSSVSGAGDVNGDGFDDLVIGAPAASPGSHYGSGQSYVVFGKAARFPASFDVGSLDGNNGFAMNGVSEGSWSGDRVSGAGDVNDDGFDDLIVGVGFPDALDSHSYVVFGAARGFPASLDLASLDGSNGFALLPWAGNGSSVSGAGDVNADGFDDLIVGATNQDRGYVIFGAANGFGASLDLMSLDGSNGFAMNGVSPYGTGTSVSGAGDVNADGFDDVIIGAPQFTPPSDDEDPGRAGQSYVVFGKPRIGPITGTDGHDTLAGTELGETIRGLDGRDRLLGERGPDAIFGGEGADRIHGGGGDDTIDGGPGRDILYGGAGTDTFVLADGDTFDLIQDFEVGIDRLELKFDGLTAATLRSVDNGTGALLQADLGSGFVTLANIVGAAGVPLVPPLLQPEVPGDTSTLYTLEVGGEVRSRIDVDDDDWFKVELEGGTTYQFDLAGDLDPFSEGWFDLSLYDLTPAWIASGGYNGPNNVQLTYTPAEDESCYVGVYASKWAHGDYTLALAELETAAPSAGAGSEFIDSYRPSDEVFSL